MSRMSKALSVTLMLVILSTITAIVYMEVTPHNGERFTEFYMLGPEGKAGSYPKDARVGKAADVILGIVNRENAEAAYGLLVKSGDVIINKIEPIILANGQKWEQQVSFTLSKVGDNQTVDFLLYKDEAVDPYLSLNLRIDVK